MSDVKHTRDCSKWLGGKIQRKQRHCASAFSVFKRLEFGDLLVLLLSAASIKSILFDIGHHRIVSPGMSQNKKYHRAIYQ